MSSGVRVGSGPRETRNSTGPSAGPRRRRSSRARPPLDLEAREAAPVPRAVDLEVGAELEDPPVRDEERARPGREEDPGRFLGIEVVREPVQALDVPVGRPGEAEGEI